jgi:hypothetical protein
MEQADEVLQLRKSIRLRDVLVGTVKPAGETSRVIEFDSDAAFVEAANVVRYPIRRNPFLNTATTFYVEMSGIACA